MPSVLQLHCIRISCTVGHLRQDIFLLTSFLLFGSDPCRVPGTDWLQRSVPVPQICKVLGLSDPKPYLFRQIRIRFRILKKILKVYFIWQKNIMKN
jgi:hypothetical protein